MAAQQQSKALHISLWVAQILLALAFGMAGFMKISMPLDELVKNGMSFVSSYSSETVRIIGVCEILAALGLILPSALRIKPILTPIAAVGIAIIMVLAIQYHGTHNEPFIPNIVMLLLASFVAWGRFVKAPIQAK